MTRKQKHLLTRILVAAVLFLAGSLLHLPEYVEMGVFLVCYAVVGWDIVWKAITNILHNHSQKLLSFRYNIDTNRVEARFTDGSAVANRMPNCLRTSSTRYFTVGLTRRIECHRFFMATAENHCNVFCVTNWSSE